MSKRLAALAASSLVLLAMLAFAATVLADTPDPSAGTTVQVTNVSWGGNSGNPTVTITGTGFGRKAPAGVSADQAPGCSGIGGNPGLDYANSLWFIDNAGNWRGGQGKPPTSGTCVGVIVNSWSSTSISLSFGSWYSHNGWVANQGDNFVWSVKGYPYGGLVSYP